MNQYRKLPPSVSRPFPYSLPFLSWAAGPRGRDPERCQDHWPASATLKGFLTRRQIDSWKRRVSQRPILSNLPGDITSRRGSG
ncbi:hypothetical protein BDZ89DRAFT_625684 [Hymenopellis radicata]|nr:hypothetical protein BDZ89DRAFT_625684 [Hymenopellis radicata]